MAWSFQQAAVTGTSTTATVSATLGSAPTVGTTMVCVVAGRGSASAWTTPTGFTIATTSFDWGAGQLAIYYRVVQSGDSATVSATNGAASAKAMKLYEVAGLTATPLDQAGSQSGGTNTSAVSLAATGANSQSDEFVIAAAAGRPATNTWTWGGGYTDDGDFSGGSGVSGVALGTAYFTESSTVTSSTTFTQSDTNNHGAAIATFKVSAGGSSVNADAAQFVTATQAAAAASDKPVAASQSATATQAVAAASTKPVTASQTVTATQSATATVVPAGKAIDAAQSLTATQASAASVTKPVAAAQTVTATQSATASVTTTQAAAAAQAITVTQAATMTVVTAAGITYRFVTPTTEEQAVLDAQTGLSWTRSVGITVIKTGGSYRQVRYPKQTELEAADEYYLGGHSYTVDADEAAALTTAGYGSYVSPVTP